VKNKTSAKKKTTKPTSKPDVRNVFVGSLAKTIFETFWETGQLVELRDSEILVFGKQEFFLSCSLSARGIADAVIAEIEHKKESK
jgi:hypothetical protein